ncbi:MAG: 2-hydroxychromene-2-carboxylate isomerase [Rhizobiaceae bacterium]
MKTRSLEFWYDFTSTYSYLAAERIMSLADSQGVTVSWHPFLLGPIFQKQGWDNSPFNIFKAKGEYMWRDMERSAKNYGIPFVANQSSFPMNGLLAARIGLCFPTEEQRGAFTRAVYRAQFVRGEDISAPPIISAILDELGHDPELFFARAKSADIKQRLFDNTADAQNKGVFGAPSFITEGGELFWGDDRLEQALDWARK